MILPIYTIGARVLKRKTKKVALDHEGLDSLIENMWETLYHAQGVGLAAPQIGQSLRIFVVDTTQLAEEGKPKGIKSVFINPEMLDEHGSPWTYKEGCLSIPGVWGDVERLSQIKLRYMDQDFMEHVQSFSGIDARVIQHEYDHLEGILFTELLKSGKKKKEIELEEYVEKKRKETGF